MSFQPLPLTWKSSIPRTIAADSACEYAFRPAVWWTTANSSRSTTAGFARTIDSSARHAERRTIGGEPATESVRIGISTAGLQTNQARSRRTSPWSR